MDPAKKESILATLRMSNEAFNLGEKRIGLDMLRIAQDKMGICPWCGLPRNHSPTKRCTGLEAGR